MNGFNKFGGTPPAVKNIIFINVIMLLATIVLSSQFKIDLNDILGAHFFQSEHFKLHQLVTYMFMHDTTNMFHIFFNMFALWMFGKVLESVWGTKRFLIYYFVTGVGAIAFNMLVQYFELSHLSGIIDAYAQNPNFVTFNSFINKHISEPSGALSSFINQFSADEKNPKYISDSILILHQYYFDVFNSPTIGASGAVFGILLAFGMLFPNTELMLIFPPIPIKAKWVVIGYGAIELYSGVTQSGSNIAHFAHLGGMVFGFFLIKYWKADRKTFY
jgi:membrane associated rhomboid family serine protease